MALFLHRSPRTEDLLEALATQLSAHWPADQLEPVPIMVGSRGMERWLRHRLAERMDIAMGLNFPFPRQMLEGAVSWVLDEKRAERLAFWQTPAAVEDPWQADALALRLIPLLRSRAGSQQFRAVARYLAYATGTELEHRPIHARELLFARQVADTLDRMLHERPVELDRWIADPPSEHAWLADLLGDLRKAIAAEDPAKRLSRLEKIPAPQEVGRVVHVFGMSTLGLGELLRVERLAVHLDIHLYLMTPSAVWWQDVKPRTAARKALQEARTPEQLRQTLADLASQNPLLAGLGQPSQFLQAKLEQIGYQDTEIPETSPPPAAPPMLQALQQWVIAAEPPRSPDQPAWIPDQSLQFHSAYGPLRQVEVLRDRLLALLQSDTTLWPRDILVMTPDVETYAPLVAAVFGRATPPLPVEIADLGLSSANPLAEALLRVLQLAEERVTASQLLDLLQLGPVRKRFGLEPGDQGALREMAEASAMRWGFDAADRARHHQPETDQNTVRFSLERLALGALLPDDAPQLVPGPPMAVEASPVGDQERVALLGRWMALLAALRHHSEHLREPRTVKQWRSDLLAALEELTETTDKTGFLHSEIAQALEQLDAQAEACPLPLERSALVRWLSGRFDLPQHGDRPIGGAIQVCALEPMRSVPFAVVALLGMDDGAFPRSSTPPSWDPFASPRPGERDRRAADRHLLLEALLCARKALIVLWSGRSVTSGKPLPAAVPIEELIGVVAQQTGCLRENLLTGHPLQPWSLRAFVNGPQQSFSADMAEVGRRLAALRRRDAEPRRLAWSLQLQGPLPNEDEPPGHLTAEALAGALANGGKLLLRDRLGLTMAQDAAPLADREPLELEGLDTWGLRDRMMAMLTETSETLEELSDHTDVWLDRLVQIAAGRGELPLQAGGRAVLRVEWTKALNTLAQVRAVPGEVAEQAPWTLALSALTLHGRPRRTLTTPVGLVLQELTASTAPNGRTQLMAWVQLLLAAALQPGVAAAHIACAGDKGLWLEAPPQEQAYALLDDMALLWREGRRRALPLFGSLSGELARLSASGIDTVEQLDPAQRAKLQEAWAGSKFRSGDASRPEAQQLYRGIDLDELLADPGEFSAWALARRVWLPIIRASTEVKTDEIQSYLGSLTAAPQEHP